MVFNKKIVFTCQNDIYEYRTILPEDVTNEYISGLKNQNSYLENNPSDINMEKQKDYVLKKKLSNNDSICGLFINSVLIGTAGLQNLTGDGNTSIGIFVFNSNIRGKGFGKTLVWASCLIASYIFNKKIFEAGMEKDNIPSIKSFLSCGFKIINEDERYYKVRLYLKNLIMPAFINNVKIVDI